MKKKSLTKKVGGGDPNLENIAYCLINTASRVLHSTVSATGEWTEFDLI